MNPRIGIPVRLSDPRSDQRVAFANRLTGVIAEHLVAHGAIPVFLTAADVAAAPDIDGVLLPGGGDLDPGLYGQRPDPRVYDVNPEQDDLDFAALEYALKRNLPVLGICRGMQLINVLYGGSLIQDLAPGPVVHKYRLSQRPEHLKDAFSMHPASTVPASRLAAALGPAVDTPSAHHQAVDELGSGLVVAARAADGCIEAIEHAQRQILGVQWHPEVTAHTDVAQARLFADFVALAAPHKAVPDMA